MSEDRRAAPARRVVETQARTIDIVPTVLEPAGLRIRDGIQATSLAARARGDDGGPGPPAYSESGRNFHPENPRQPIAGVAGKWRMMRDDRGDPPLPEGLEDQLRSPGYVGGGEKP